MLRLSLSLAAVATCLTILPALVAAVETEMPINALTEEVLSKGMKLDAALEILKKHQVDAEEVFRPVLSRDPNVDMREFLIRPSFRKTDGLFLAAESTVVEDQFGGIHRSDWKISGISWHFDWDTDAALPLALWGHRVLHMDKIHMRILCGIPDAVLEKRREYKRQKGSDPTQSFKIDN